MWGWLKLSFYRLIIYIDKALKGGILTYSKSLEVLAVRAGYLTLRFFVAEGNMPNHPIGLGVAKSNKPN